MPDLTRAAAYGGERWSPRTAPLRDEIGALWARCGLRDEWGPLRAVLLHRPGPELAVRDPDAAQLLAPVDPARAAAEHDALTHVNLKTAKALNLKIPEPVLLRADEMVE
jgi:hypothetical protein